MLNERCYALLQMILSANRPVPIAKMAETLHITARSVRYQLDKIDFFLKESSLPLLRRRQNAGISAQLAPAQRHRLKNALDGLCPARYIASRQERTDMDLAVLLCRAGYVTIDELAEKNGVSRTTAIKDLQALRAGLPEGCRLVSKTRRGLRLEGEERLLRRLVIEVFRRNLGLKNEILTEITPALKTMRRFPLTELEHLFKDGDLRFIENCVTAAEKQLAITFSDAGFYAIVIHIAIAVERIRIGSKIAMPEKELSACQTTPEFAAASYIAQSLEKRFKVAVPRAEIGYITVRLLGSNIQRPADASKGREDAKLQVFTRKILQLAALRLNQAQLLYDEQLFSGLKEHLRPALYRLRNDLAIVNPLMQDIRQSYAELFEAVRASVAPLEDAVKKRFNDAEIGYLTLHFGAAMERIKEKSGGTKRVLVVCGTGFGTARILSSRLQQLFQVEIVAIAARRQIREILARRKVDLIVATLPLESMQVPCVRVNPLLAPEDMSKLRGFLLRERLPERVSLEAVLDLVERHCVIKERKALIRELAALLENSRLDLRKGAGEPVLMDVLSKENIALQVAAKDWEEAVRCGGKMMLDCGMIEPGYIEAMVHTVREMGAYIVIAPGIAMPHARPEDGAKKVGGAIVTLKNPVNFGNEENDPVSVLIFLCAVDKIAHLNALADIMQLFEDENFKDAALKAQNKQDLLKYIENKVKEGEKNA